MTKDNAIKLALEAAYLAGFDASGEGYNAEYPFGDHARNPEEDAVWIKDRDNALSKALAEQPAQQEPVAWVEGVEIYWHNAPDLNDWIRQNGQPLYTSPPARKPLTDDTCKWARPDSDHMPDTWEASCGAMWTFTEGGPKDNDMHFCPNCGKPAIEAARGIKE